MVDAEKLKQKIEDSGLKIGFIAGKLGLSHQGFLNKLNGEYSFKLDEIQKLCNTMNLSAEDRDSIFFADDVDK